MQEWCKFQNAVSSTGVGNFWKGAFTRGLFASRKNKKSAGFLQKFSEDGSWHASFVKYNTFMIGERIGQYFELWLE